MKDITDIDKDNSWYSWYKTFDRTHQPGTRQQWYNAVAPTYLWARAHYPDEIVDRTVAKADLSAGDSLLEIGCGPGIATAPFAARRLVMTCVEPSPAACELAQKVGCDRGQVKVINATFEAYDLAGQQFDAVLAATSFHWVSPEIACKKSAAALKPRGNLILLWSTPPQLNKEICDGLQSVYAQYGLADLGEKQWRSQTYYQENFEMFAETVTASGYFASTSVDITQYQGSYSLEKYLALLSTLSDYIALADETRAALMQSIAQRLRQHQSNEAFAVTHWIASQVAPLTSC
ncbi:MAG: class I SAM-dependent methyltransferase [Cyanobacteria bacterium J06623_5]